uniref:Uncharacterized protein n=1 Tax=Magnetococcus massalia (strain MO-1) TaxID=451514 RepID=A0A1S7LGM5_MAGMO|nr:protein of unknown function [Candidatus Magnetococcus massalia]
MEINSILFVRIIQRPLHESF